MSGVAFFISHAPHIPGRKESYARLREQLGDVPCETISERLPNHEWSFRMWTAGLRAKQPVFLQDDVVLCDGFHDNLAALLERFPEQLLSLYQAHPVAPELAGRDVAAIRMPGCLGTSYTMPRAALKEILAWRSKIPRLRVRWVLGEDQITTAWAALTGRHWVHPIPGLVDHDAGLRSSNPHVGGYPRASAVAQGIQKWPGQIVDAPWLWKGSEQTLLGISEASAKPGEARIFGRPPIIFNGLLRGQMATMQLDGSLYTRRHGESRWKLRSRHPTELEADMAVEKVIRDGAFFVWVEDEDGPLDMESMNAPAAREFVDESTRYFTGDIAQQIEAAVAAAEKVR